MTLLAPTLEAFFTRYMAGQRQASPRTIGSYRDTWRLFLGYALEKTGTAPAGLDIAAVDTGLVSGFLAHLEAGRGNTARTRNARLAAIRSFFKFAALRHPEHAGTIARVLAIPAKKHGRRSVSYLTAAGAAALIAAPDTTTWHGRRDHALLALAAQTGLRSSELTGLTRGDVQAGTGPTVRCHGKGRKDRVTPLTANTAAVIRTWLRQQPGEPARPAVPDHYRAAAVLRRHPGPGRTAHRDRGGGLPVHPRQKRHPAHPAAFRGHGPAARRGRSRHDRPLDGAREPPVDAAVHPRRPQAQGEGPGPDLAADDEDRQVPPARQAPRVPRGPGIMPLA
jgi:site-specific recombinase XerD